MIGEVERQVFEVDYKGWLKKMMEEVWVAEFDELVIGVPSHFRGEKRVS